jgi:hypothetical protein
MLFCTLVFQGARGQEIPAPQVGQENNTSENLELSNKRPSAEKKMATRKKKKKSKYAEASSVSGSEPDFEKEHSFNTVYKSYNQQPTPIESWEKAVSQRKFENYQIQKGDTLSDISNTFFGDPGFWPKIWSFNNGTIENPHEIVPALPIRFFSGSATDVPTMELGQESELKPQTVASASLGNNADKQVGDYTVKNLPPSRRHFTPVLKNIPNSLPSGRVGIYVDRSTKIDLQLEPLPPLENRENLGYFLSESPVTGVGKVISAELDLQAVGEFAYIYISLESGAAKNLIVVKNLAEIESLPGQNNNSGTPRATIIEVQGQIEVLELVNVNKNIYRAMVKKSLNLVEVGSLLIPGDLPMIDTTSSPANHGAEAHIIGGQYGPGRSLFGSHSLIFLDAGIAKGFSDGKSFPIIADEHLRSPETDVNINSRKVGEVKIVKATEKYSTGFVTRATDKIVKGDFVGSAPKVSEALISDRKMSDDEVNPTPDEKSTDEVPSSSGSESDNLDL